jgi:hypothetical protein
MQLVREINDKDITTYSDVPKFYCKAFEDNIRALEIARTHKMRPRTKHINLVYHHFRSFVKKGLVVIWPIKTEDQPAQIMASPAARDLFLKHRNGICGF